MAHYVYCVLAAWCLFHHTKAGIDETITLDGVNFDFYSADAASSLITDGNPCAEGVLAVWESEDEYKRFIDEMVSASVAPDIYHTGIIKRSNSVYLRTYTGGRLAPFTNSFLTYADRSTEHCVQLDFDTDPDIPENRNFYRSAWTVGNDCDLEIGDRFICMHRTDGPCTEMCLGVLNVSPIISPERQFSTCMWQPYPWKVVTHTQAIGICNRYGGVLMNLIETTDLTKLDSLVDKEQSWNRYWLGLTQKPGESHPRWADGTYVFLTNVWELEVNYGSALNTVPYAGIWDVGTEGMNLWMTAPFVESEDVVYDVRFNERVNREAFVLCEATMENFCLTNAPHVNYAIKSAQGNTVVYMCQDGWEFPDGTTEKDIPCFCGNVAFSDDIPDCVLKNPCTTDPSLCGPHGYCIPTHRYPNPYYCVCEKGYEKSPTGECVDINECNGDPCSVYYGRCINMEGSYWCQCTQGYNWDTDGQCKAVDTGGGGGGGGGPVAAIHTMTVYFLLGMEYDPGMNDHDSDLYNNIKAALDAMAVSIYGEGQPVTVDSFHVMDESSGRSKIKVVFNIYVQADVTRLSVYAWRFFNYVKVTVTDMYVNGHAYPFYGSITFFYPYGNRDIEITSLCSIFNAIDQCHGSPCKADRHEPYCACKTGYHGEFCKDKDRPWPTTFPPPPRRPEPKGLSDAEIGLIVAVCLLFVIVIPMPLFIWCCFNNSGGRHRPHMDESYGHMGSLYAPQVLRGAFRAPLATKWRYR